MSGLPYYPRYPRDFFEGTAGMPFEEKAAYGLVLDIIYMMGDRSLPDDPHFISGHLGMSVRKWISIRKKLIDRGKLNAENGIISNKRADNIKIIQSKYQDKQREKASKPRKNNNLQEPKLSQSNTNINNIDDDTDARGNPPSQQIQTAREVLIGLMEADPVSGLTGPNGRMIGSQADMLVYRQWRDDLGLSMQEIETVIGEVMQRKRDGPPGSFKYFNNAMAKYAGMKSQPKLEPFNEGNYDNRTSNSKPTGTRPASGHESLYAGFAAAANRHDGEGETGFADGGGYDGSGGSEVDRWPSDEPSQPVLRVVNDW